LAGGSQGPPAFFAEFGDPEYHFRPAAADAGRRAELQKSAQRRRAVKVCLFATTGTLNCHHLAILVLKTVTCRISCRSYSRGCSVFADDDDEKPVRADRAAQWSAKIGGEP
jgi:hypothetical protein